MGLLRRPHSQAAKLSAAEDITYSDKSMPTDTRLCGEELCPHLRNCVTTWVVRIVLEVNGDRYVRSGETRNALLGSLPDEGLEEWDGA